jgi:hypothetical protein
MSLFIVEFLAKRKASAVDAGCTEKAKEPRAEEDRATGNAVEPSDVHAVPPVATGSTTAPAQAANKNEPKVSDQTTSISSMFADYDSD